jgi:hypothetical protein
LELLENAISSSTTLLPDHALVSTLVDENRLGAGMGAAQSFKEFGDMTGPLAVGLITQFYGVHTGFITGRRAGNPRIMG